MIEMAFALTAFVFFLLGMYVQGRIDSRDWGDDVLPKEAREALRRQAE